MRRLTRRLQHGEEATLTEHLGELRTRIFIAGSAVGLAFIGAFIFHDNLIEWLTRPLPDEKQNQLVTLGVTEPFFTAMKVSFYAALVIAMPIVLYQLWSFLAPAVQEHTQRAVSVFVAISTGLMLIGIAFGYFVVLPRALAFLTNFDENLYNDQIRAQYYYSFTSLVLVGMAVVFNLPIFILALVRLQVISSQWLRRNRRISWFLLVFVAVLLPTVDPVSLTFEAVPLLVLFEASIWLAVLMERRWQRSGVLWAATE